MGKASRRQQRKELRELRALREQAVANARNPEHPDYQGEPGCFMCVRKHTPEYMRSMAYRNEHNKWDDIRDVMKVLDDPNWSWARNTDCKYLDIRVDMRDGGAVIEAASSVHEEPRRISPKQLAWQYSKETPNPIPDSEAYA